MRMQKELTVKIDVITLAFGLAILNVTLLCLFSQFNLYAEHSSTISYIRAFVNIGSFILNMIVFAMCSRRMTKIFFVLFVFYTYGFLVTVCGLYFPVSKLPTQLLNMTSWVGVFFTCYIYTKEYGISEKFFRFSFCLHCAVFLLFLVAYFTVNQMSDYLKNTQLVNSVYYLLFLVPIALCIDNEKMNIVTLVLTFIATVFSAKRGALIAFALVFVLWFLGQNRTLSTTKKIRRIIVIGLVAFFVYKFSQNLIDSYNLNIYQRMEALLSGADSGSGRNSIWNGCISIMKQDGFLHNLVGRGYDSMLYSGNYLSGYGWAHNDFLQVAFDYGYIGLVIFIIFFIELFRTYMSMKKRKYKYSVIFLISLSIVLVNCMVSMCFVYPYWILGIAVFWGIAYGDYENYCEIENAKAI